MPKIILALLATVLFSGLALAQVTPAPVPAPEPNWAWKIVLKNFLNHTQLVRPELYPDRSTCELAKQGMGYAEIEVLGLHGVCVFVPSTFN